MYLMKQTPAPLPNLPPSAKYFQQSFNNGDGHVGGMGTSNAELGSVDTNVSRHPRPPPIDVVNGNLASAGADTKSTTTVDNGATIPDVSSPDEDPVWVMR